MSATYIEITEVTKRYPGQVALDDVSLTLRTGEVHALVGENGAGKSTLIKVLAGLVEPDSGSVSVDGRRITRVQGPKMAQALGFAFVHQEPHVALNLSVGENIFAGHLPTGGGFVRRRELRARSAELLRSLDVDLDPDRPLRDFGAASRRMVEIARAVSRGARLLVLDEPTAALPSHERDTLLGLVRRFADGGGTVLYVSHHLDEVLDVAHVVTALRNGRYVATRPRTDVDRDAVIELILGTDLVRHERPQANADSSRAVLRVDGLTLHDGAEPMSLSLHAGEIVGLFGRVDAGHEDFTKVVAGHRRASAGTMTLAGRSYRPRSVHGARRSGVSFLPGERKRQGVFPQRSIVDNMVAGSGVGRRYGLVRRGVCTEVAHRWRDTLGIKAPDTNAAITTLSGGNQQKVIFARLMLTDPTVLVLEHPTAGVDLGARQDIYRAIREAAEEGLGVLVASDDLDELQGLADRIAVFRSDTIRSIVDREEMSSTRLLELAL